MGKIARQKTLLKNSVDAYKDLCDYLCYKPLNSGTENNDNNLAKTLPQPKDLFNNWIEFLEHFRFVWDDTAEDGTKKKSPKKVKKGNLQPNPKKGWHSTTTTTTATTTTTVTTTATMTATTTSTKSATSTSTKLSSSSSSSSSSS